MWDKVWKKRVIEDKEGYFPKKKNDLLDVSEKKRLAFVLDELFMYKSPRKCDFESVNTMVRFHIGFVMRDNFPFHKQINNM